MDIKKREFKRRGLTISSRKENHTPQGGGGRKKKQ